MSGKTKLNYTIRGNVDGGNYRNITEVQVDRCDVTELTGPVSIHRTSFLTPNRLEITFNYCTEVNISFEMARNLLDELHAMNLDGRLDDDKPEDEDE